MKKHGQEGELPFGQGFAETDFIGVDGHLGLRGRMGFG